MVVLTLAGTEIQGKTTQQDRRGCRDRRIALPVENTWKRVQPTIGGKSDMIVNVESALDTVSMTKQQLWLNTE
jgi:hypothetical protein